MAFEVSGKLIERPVKKGDMVKVGQLLARLDPRDYKQDLDGVKAEMERARAHRDRIRKAAEKNAVSKQDVSDAEAAFDVARSKVGIKVKALEDTYLRAKFAGLIANTYVENFENISAKQKILVLQDVSSIKIDINVPEERVAMAKRDRNRFRFVASFDYLPDREFDLEIKEFATEADPKSQTYTATFIMPAPEDVNILPGMTATVREFLRQAEDDGSSYSVPIDVVPVDGLGNYYVWLLKKDSGDIYTAHRVDVTVGDMMGDSIQILSGLKKGDRIAMAGVHYLQEGQRVRLLDAKGEENQP
jgi:RND family efflux transporter MFP subunit